LNNLLSNAAKYGNNGGRAVLTVSLSGERLRVSVWNEGPGFPESEKIRLFRRFSKIQTPELLKRKGHGVGLYVSWNIIQLHGGRIWASSQHGQWAEFSFELPPRMDQCILH
jgi:signal transduction histidine kinase